VSAISRSRPLVAASRRSSPNRRRIFARAGVWSVAAVGLVYWLPHVLF
jgi:hypothetical protein